VEAEPASGEVRFGRGAGVDVELPFATVSALHARVFRHGRGWAVADLGSVNGTFFGQERLPPHTPQPLPVGATVRLADVLVTLEEEVGEGPSPSPKGAPPESTATLARRLVNDLFQGMAGAEVARLVVVSGPAAGQALRLTRPDHPYKVGRAPECDLVLPDEDVSREHAAFERRWEGVFARDLGSKNGMELATLASGVDPAEGSPAGGERIVGARRLRDGDTVRLGGSALRVEDPEERYLQLMQSQNQPPAASIDTQLPDLAIAHPAASPPAEEEEGAGAVQPGPLANRRGVSSVPLVVTTLAVLALIAVVGLAGWLLFGQE
jgi:pSer/pThr/pTyr-binding forkhead associated (FHA) protein